jgi:predicted type IV restriction endonuclease
LVKLVSLRKKFRAEGMSIMIFDSGLYFLDQSQIRRAKKWSPTGNIELKEKAALMYLDET